MKIAIGAIILLFGLVASFNLPRIVNCAIGSLWIPVLSLITAICFLSGLKRFGVEISTWKVLGVCFAIVWFLGTTLYVYIGFIYNDITGEILGLTILLAIVFWLISLVAGKKARNS